MNIKLDPPPVPPLTSSQRSRLRNRVMDKSMPGRDRSTRRWVAPVVAVGAVAAVVAGTLVITSKPSSDPGVAAPPAPAGVDLGAVLRTDVANLGRECTFPKETGTAKLLWSRHVRGITKDSTASVAVAVHASGRHPAIAKLGYRVCMMRTPPSGRLGAVGTVAVVADKAWNARPTAAQGLVLLGTDDTGLTADNATLQSWSIYRARPEIARVESRYVWKGEVGEWTTGVVDAGFAYTEVQAPGKFKNGDRLKQEVRAFDAAGEPVPVKL
jgi:hypothetical protein